jgi:starch synthase
LILGSGNTAIENQLNSLLSQDYKGGNIVVITKISALNLCWFWFLLMPSRVEPCGLNKCTPCATDNSYCARRTGGLKDTVIDFGDDGNGIMIRHLLVIFVIRFKSSKFIYW